MTAQGDGYVQAAMISTGRRMIPTTTPPANNSTVLMEPLQRAP
jgi:hypothetical protein